MPIKTPPKKILLPQFEISALAKEGDADANAVKTNTQAQTPEANA